MKHFKVYKKTKVVDTPLASVQIESEFHEKASRRKPAAEGPPPWLPNADPSPQNPDEAKQSEQKHHLSYLFQLGKKHSIVSCGVQEPFTFGEEKSAGSRSFEEKTTGGESVGAHRATRQLDASSEAFGDDSNKPSNLRKTQESVTESYLGINLRDISKKLFMATMIDSQNGNDETDGVEETKEEDGAALPKKIEGLSSITGFDIGKVISKNLLEAMPAMASMSPFSKSSDGESIDRAKGKAPLFTEEMREKQRKSLAPVDEIRIRDHRDGCALLSVEDSGCYLQRIKSDDMSCVTIPNLK